MERKCGKYGMMLTMGIVISLLAMPIGSVEAYVPAEGIYGHITDLNGNPLSGITVTGGGTTDTTDNNGYYFLAINTYGTYLVTATGSGLLPFAPQSKYVSISRATGVGVGNFQMVYIETIWGYVYDSNGAPLSGINVIGTNGYQTRFVTTNSAGMYSMLCYPYEGNWLIDLTQRTGYFTFVDYKVPLPSNGAVRQDFKYQANVDNVYIPYFIAYASVNPEQVEVQIIFSTSTSRSSSITVTTPIMGGSTSDTKSVSHEHTMSTASIDNNGHYTSLVVYQKAIITGVFGMGTSSLYSTSVLSWYPVYSDNYHEIDYDPIATITAGMSEYKGGIMENIPCGTYRTTTTQVKGSTTYSFDPHLTLSVPLPSAGYSAGLGFGFSYSSTSSDQRVIQIKATSLDGSSAHDIEYYIEGSESDKGAIVHVWQVG